MKLLTHNMLICPKKACMNTSFPMKITASKITQEAEECNMAFLERMVEKIEWVGILSAAKDLNMAGIPETIPENWSQDEMFCNALFSILMNVEITEGSLTCPNCAAEYPIANGIPNMILPEDEV